MGKGDWLVEWRKPEQRNGPIPFHSEYQNQLNLRLIEVRVPRRGFRTKKLKLLTTLLDKKEFSIRDIADLYRNRWYAETDIRAIKQGMQMDFLRSKSPELVEKEIWVHMLAYNLICKLMVRATALRGMRPRRISFTAAVQAHRALIDLSSHQHSEKTLQLILHALSLQAVGNRPKREQPRAVKQLRRSKFPQLRKRGLNARLH